MVDDCNMDERLENSWRLVYYQVSGERGIPGCSGRSDIYLGECRLARASLFTDHRRIIRVLNFRGWSRPQNYFNSEIFPIYGTAHVSYNDEAVFKLIGYCRKIAAMKIVAEHGTY